MIKYLFQGDSITDAGRERDTTRIGTEVFGYGYPILFASEVLKNNKGKYEFVNRGISGNRIVDVYARIKADIINLKPDVMSILIGVNDVWHEFGSQNGVATPKFEKIYSMLIEEIKEALPDIKIIILGDSALPAGSLPCARRNQSRSWNNCQNKNSFQIRSFGLINPRYYRTFRRKCQPFIGKRSASSEGCDKRPHPGSAGRCGLPPRRKEQRCTA